MLSFPEPKDLEVDFVNRIGDSQPKSIQMYDVSNPHPGFNKDPNILNEFGHTKFPMFVENKDGVRVIVNNEKELAELDNPPSVPQSGEAPKTSW